VLTLTVWKLVRIWASRKANALDVAGLEKEHWLKGWVSLAFSNGFPHIRYSRTSLQATWIQ